MSTSPHETPEDPPVDTEELPAQDDVDQADAARQVDEDPEELPNYTDPEAHAGPADEQG